MNRKRAKRGKKVLDPLKPYYWVNVEENEKTLEARTRAEHEGRSLSVRFMVNPHFRRYHTNNGLVRYWIDTFPKGPDTAPWKSPEQERVYQMWKKGTHY